MIQNYSVQLFVYLRPTQQRSEQLQKAVHVQGWKLKRMKTKAKLGEKRKKTSITRHLLKSQR